MEKCGKCGVEEKSIRDGRFVKLRNGKDGRRYCTVCCCEHGNLYGYVPCSDCMREQER